MTELLTNPKRAVRKHGSFCVMVTKIGNKSVTKMSKNLSHVLPKEIIHIILKKTLKAETPYAALPVPLRRGRYISMRRKLSKKQIGAMGLAVMMGVQTPAMAAKTSQESTTQETVLEPQTEESETAQVEIAESQAEEIETT